MSTEYYSAPLWDAIVADHGEYPPIMYRCLCSSLNGILDALAGEHVVVPDGGVYPNNFSGVFEDLIDGNLPRPVTPNIVLRYAPDSPSTSGAALFDATNLESGAITTSGVIEAGHAVKLGNASNKHSFAYDSAYYSVDGGELIEIEEVLDVGYRFTMPEGSVVVIVSGTDTVIG